MSKKDTPATEAIVKMLRAESTSAAKDHDAFMAEFFKVAAVRLGSLQSIVKKLPVNGDDDPIVPGDVHWCGSPKNYVVVQVVIESIGKKHSEWVHVGQLREAGDEFWEEEAAELYSSRGSAETAREKHG